MTTTTEKILDLFENENNKELVDDVEALKQMGYYNDLIEALLLHCLGLRYQNKLLNSQMEIAENYISKANEILKGK